MWWFWRLATPKFFYDSHGSVVKEIGFTRKTVEAFQIRNKRSIEKLARATGSAHGLFAAFRTTHDCWQVVPPIYFWV
jgi:hypothetical protein